MGNSVGVIYKSLNEFYEKDRVLVKEYLDRYEVIYHKKLTQVAGHEKCFARYYDDLFTDVEYLRGAGEYDPDPRREEEHKARSARRVRSRTKDLILSNRWDYWVTLTCAPEKVADRYDLAECVSRFRDLVKSRNTRFVIPFQYVLLPEQHQDGAYHFHGFVRGVDGDELRVNKNSRVEIDFLADGLGFMTMTPVRLLPPDELHALSMYTLKYATKAVEDSRREKYAHAYFCSRGLDRPREWAFMPEDEGMTELKYQFIYLHECSCSYDNEYVASRMYTKEQFKELVSLLGSEGVDNIRFVNSDKKCERCGKNSCRSNRKR